MIRIDRIVTSWWILSVLTLSSLCCNAAQLLLLLLKHARILSRKRSVALRQHVSNAWWPLWLFVVEGWCGVSYRFTGDKHALDLPKGKPNSLCMANHAPGFDFITAVCVARRAQGMGTGRCVGLMKRSLQFLPVIGWTQYLQGTVFLARSLEKDRPMLERRFAQMARPAEWPRPFWMALYPEGTRITPGKRAAAHAFADKRGGLPKFEHVLLPRVKGMTVILAQLHKVMGGVVDYTTAYEGGAFYPWDILLWGRFRTRRVHVHLSHVDALDIPASDTEGAQSKWLMDRFRLKEALLSRFAKRKNFADTELASLTQTPQVAMRLFWFWSVVSLMTFSRAMKAGWFGTAARMNGQVQMGAMSASVVMTLYAGFVAARNCVRHKEKER